MAGTAEVKFEGNSGAEVVVSGSWKLCEKNITAEACILEISRNDCVKSVAIRHENLSSWDSSLVVFLSKLIGACKNKNLAVDAGDIPVGARRLIDLSNSCVNKSANSWKNKSHTFCEFLFAIGFAIVSTLKDFAIFFGELSLGIAALFNGKTRIREQSFAVILQDVGARALPIVALISFLVGLIIAFVSIVQLVQFGASIYVADLVGISMMREMGCIMTGVIMSGRTGAAFAATIGTMVVNDEVDALHTTGISSVNFLILPRMFALMLMMPLLCIFSSFIGIFGGLCASVLTTDLTISQYYVQTTNAVSIGDFFVGVLKCAIFGVLVSIIGCMKGLRCGRSAEDVGLAATSAVVTSITAIIAADAAFSVIFYALGI